MIVCIANTCLGMKRRPVYGDEDEIMQEQEERRRRAALNQEFKVFCERLAASDVSLNVDIPIRTLGFYGVPFRQNVLCQPTRDCLVHLTDPPFLVVPLADVEVASLERVLFSLKNFDLIFIMKDKTLPPQHIDAIPMTYLEPIKEWLDSCDVYYMTSNINFNWPNVLKTVREDPQGFYEMGGWRMIQANPDAPPSDASEDDSDEGDSVYEEPEEDDDEVGGGDSDGSDASLASDDDGDDEDYDSDASDDEDASEEDEEDEDAMDWDELEEKAKRDEMAQRKRK
jgi:nucleosome binding factor SPN SPT16 subunit